MAEFRRQIGLLRHGHIRGVRDNEIKRPCDAVCVVSFDEVHAPCQAVVGDIGRRNLQGGGRNIGGDDLRIRKRIRAGNGDTPAAGADFQHPPDLLGVNPRAEALGDQLRDRRTGHEHPLIDPEAQPGEPGLTGQVRERFAGGNALVSQAAQFGALGICDRQLIGRRITVVLKTAHKIDQCRSLIEGVVRAVTVVQVRVIEFARNRLDLRTDCRRPVNRFIHHSARYNLSMENPADISWLDKLLVLLTRLLPARLLGSFVYLLSRSRRPWLKNSLIRGFLKLYDVNTDEAAEPVPDGYDSFNAFFTRELQPDARPIHTNPAQLLAPADGTIAQTGQAKNGQLLQAKGMHFSAVGLLANSALAGKFVNAPFATIYLAPYNYHRVHMPIAGRLLQTLFVPGKLYSVNARTTASIPNLYAVNERLVCEFETERGPFAMVLVGAINVASITTAWGGEIFPTGDGNIIHTHHEEQNIELDQGEYMGHFNMGSTVVMVGPDTGCDWNAALQPGAAVQMGAVLGDLTSQ